MGIAYNTSIVKSGLVLHLDAANVKSYPGSGTTWNDLSGGGRNATLTNGPSFITDNKGSFLFDGVDDLCTVSTPYNSSVTGLTWSVWFKGVKGASYASDYGYIVHNNSSSNSTGQSHVTIGIDASNRYYGAFSGTYATMFSNVTQSSLVVRNLTLTWDGTQQSFYVDGILSVSTALASVTTYAIDTTSGLCNYKSNYRAVNGNLYAASVYTRALSASEVKQNFEALRGRYGV